MRLSITIACILLAAAPANGQKASVEQPQVLNDLAACQRIAADTERLACFDRKVAQLSKQVAVRDVVVIDREDIRKTRRSLFGFSIPDLPFFKKDRNGSEEEEVSEITAKVQSASGDAYGKYTVRLQDGAVWRTTEPVKKAPRAGGEVTLKKAALGSYMMRVGTARGVRAMRVN